MLNLAEINLPSSPGVYRFYNVRQALLYVGKSINIAQRVRSHYQASRHDPKEARLAHHTAIIDWTLTAGETGALLLENHQIKTLHPLYNRRQRKTRQLWTLQPQPQANSDRIGLGLRALSVEQGQPDLYGLFASKGTAMKQLKALIRQFELCERVLGIEAGQGRCFGHQIGRCRGACCGEEPIEQHNQRLHRALQNRQLSAWPWPGPVVIEEPNQLHPTQSDWHLILNWAHLGTATDLNGIDPLMQQSVAEAFDLDTYFILQKALNAPGLNTYLWQNQRLVTINNKTLHRNQINRKPSRLS